MVHFHQILIILALTYTSTGAAYFHSYSCGPYGFICEGPDKLRICEDGNLLGPSFKCPANTVCNEDSSEVCENSINYIDPGTRKILRCYKNERIPDPNVPDCKGYILCIPNKNTFQGIKFKCAGNTVFNGYTRTCSTPNRYKCPADNTTKPPIGLYGDQNRRVDRPTKLNAPRDSRPIECKNYKFSVTHDDGPVRAAYFCPSRPVDGESSIRCTIFSSKYCITLEKEQDEDSKYGTALAYRKPRE